MVCRQFPAGVVLQLLAPLGHRLGQRLHVGPGVAGSVMDVAQPLVVIVTETLAHHLLPQRLLASNNNQFDSNPTHQLAV